MQLSEQALVNDEQNPGHTHTHSALPTVSENSKRTATFLLAVLGWTKTILLVADRPDVDRKGAYFVQRDEWTSEQIKCC